MAEAFYNMYSKSKNSLSAGWQPDKEVHPSTVKLMKEIGIDVSHHKPRQLTERLLEGADTIIAVNQRTCSQIPKKYLSKTKNWRLGILSYKSAQEVRRVRDKIKRKVERLITS